MIRAIHRGPWNRPGSNRMPMAPVHWLPRQARHLRTFSGFCGARLLGRDDGQKVMFPSITFFTSLDAVHGLAGDGYELAVVEEWAGRRWTAGTSGSRITS
jgi:hypothetical protein